MNITNLRERLKRTSIEGRVPIIQEYLQGVSEQERQKYREFYGVSIQTLKQNQGVTRAEIRLSTEGYLIFGIKYSTLHQMACVAAEQPIRTPRQELQNNGLKTKQTRRRNSQGKSISRLMEQKRAKIKYGPKATDRYERSE